MEIFKLEIIIANTFLQELINKLEAIGVQGYTALAITRGKGIKRGENFSEGLLPTTRNTLVFAVGNKNLTDKAIEHIQPYLNEVGGALMAYKLDYASGLS